ncbi:MAG: sigma-54 dependent transcriptional regulator [Bryobacteraceae bacterium]
MQDAIRLLLLKESNSGNANTLEHMLGSRSFVFESVLWGMGPVQPSSRWECDIVVIAADEWPNAAKAMVDWCRVWGGDVPILVALGNQSRNPESEIQQFSGIIDFFCYPASEDDVLLRIERLSKNGREIRAVVDLMEAEFAELRMAGRHPKFLAVLQQVRRIAAVDATALICGETGTGKELCARAIHYLSARRKAPFIPVDCGCLPDHLFENEMFGHERGAYTDARSRQKGLVELADGGTLLLDEVDSLSIANQGKLLRFLEERRFRPLGAECYRNADINVLAASNRDLLACVAAKQFRQDLFYRLNVLQVRIPPLRERRSDVLVLAKHFLEGLPHRKRLSPEAMQALTRHDWPGNVRELHNTIYRAAVFCQGERIDESDLGLAESKSGNSMETMSYREARLDALHSFELNYVRELMILAKGNVTQAAKRAGKERRAFGRLVQKYGLGSEDTGHGRTKKSVG